MLSWVDVSKQTADFSACPPKCNTWGVAGVMLGREMYQTVFEYCLGQFSPSIKMVFVWHISVYNKFQVLYLCVWILCIKMMMTSMLHALKHNLICLWISDGLLKKCNMSMCNCYIPGWKLFKGTMQGIMHWSHFDDFLQKHKYIKLDYCNICCVYMYVALLKIKTLFF